MPGIATARLCDRCGAPALYVADAYDIALCGHHYRQHKDALTVPVRKLAEV